MCTRTLHTWGCGHRYKITNSCRPHYPDRLCPDPDIERFQFPHDGDCNACKAAPPSSGLDRGKAGLGRYAQEIKAREKRTTQKHGGSLYSHSSTMYTPSSSSPPSSQYDGPSGSFGGRTGETSPWASDDDIPDPLRRRERKLSGIRLEQDIEWEKEHARRMEELEHHQRLIATLSKEQQTRRAKLSEELRRIEEADMLRKLQDREREVKKMRQWEEDERERRALLRDMESLGLDGDRKRYGGSHGYSGAHSTSSRKGGSGSWSGGGSGRKSLESTFFDDYLLGDPDYDRKKRDRYEDFVMARGIRDRWRGY